MWRLVSLCPGRRTICGHLSFTNPQGLDLLMNGWLWLINEWDWTKTMMLDLDRSKQRTESSWKRWEKLRSCEGASVLIRLCFSWHGLIGAADTWPPSRWCPSDGKHNVCKCVQIEAIAAGGGQETLKGRREFAVCTMRSSVFCLSNVMGDGRSSSWVKHCEGKPLWLSKTSLHSH